MLKRLFDFRGRASRLEFWIFFAASVLLTGLFDVIAAALASALWPSNRVSLHDALFTVFVTAWLVPWFALCVRRLHDRGKSGWMLVLLYGVPLLLIAIGIAVSSLGVASMSALEAIRFLSLAASIYVMLELGAGASRSAGDRFGPPLSKPARPSP